MNLNLSEKWRNIIYIVLSLGSFIITYLGAKEILGADEIALWTALSAFGFALAKINVGTEPEDK